MTDEVFREMIISMEDFISGHPLFGRWKTLRAREVLCPEWHSDFRAFLSGVGERPADCKKLWRDDPDRPYGPGNARWKKTPTHDETLAYYRKWNAAHPRHRQTVRLRDVYGLTVEQFDRMYEAQQGRCAICGEVETRADNQRRGLKRQLAVDHDHETGAVRGLLCGDCNNALGAFKDNPTTILRAIGYLRHHNRQRLKVVE